MKQASHLTGQAEHRTGSFCYIKSANKYTNFSILFVIPAQAEIQYLQQLFWIPALRYAAAGMTYLIAGLIVHDTQWHLTPQMWRDSPYAIKCQNPGTKFQYSILQTPFQSQAEPQLFTFGLTIFSLQPLTLFLQTPLQNSAWKPRDNTTPSACRLSGRKAGYTAIRDIRHPAAPPRL